MDLKELKPKDIDDVLFIEKRSFPREVQQDKDELLTTLKNNQSIGILAKKDRPVAYIVGAPLEFYGDDDASTALEEFAIDDGQYGFYNSFYLESIAVVPRERRGGVGSLLFTMMILLAKGRGYRRLVGTAYGNRGWKFAQRFNAQKINVVRGFYDDGSDGIYYEIDLTRNMDEYKDRLQKIMDPFNSIGDNTRRNPRSVMITV